MDPKKTLQTMQDFQKENFKMGMTEDMRKFLKKSGSEMMDLFWLVFSSAKKNMLNDIRTSYAYCIW